MIRDEAVAELQIIMGFRSDLSSSIVTALQIAQKHFEQSWPDPSNLPWFLITERATASTTANEERLAKPADWLGDIEEDGLWLTNPDGKEILLEKADLDDLRELYGNSTAAFPKAYAFDGLYYRLFPKPNAIYLSKMQYFSEAPTLSLGTSENSWLKYASDILIGRAGIILCAGAKDGRLSLCQQLLVDAIAAVNSKSLEIKYGGKQSSMGEAN